MVRVNRAGLIGQWLDEHRIPPTADRKVYAAGRRLFRVIGSRKDINSSSHLQPYGPRLPFYSHLIQHTVLATADLELRESDAAPPSSRQRTQPAAESVQRAPWLRGLSDNDLMVIAVQQLKQKENGCHNSFTVGKVVGNSMYCITDPAGRICWDGTQHDRNNFVLTFRRSGQLMYRCFGSGCNMHSNEEIGRWFDGYSDMLKRLDALLVPGPEPDKVLLQYMSNLVASELDELSQQPGRKGKAKPGMLPNWGRLQSAVTRYLNHYWAYIRETDVFVMHQLDAAGMPTMAHYRSDTSTSSLSRAYAFWFDEWNKSPSRREFDKIVSVPGQPMAIDSKYNIAANLMPNLGIARRRVTEADAECIKPLLEHQRRYLCAGQQEVYDYWMKWQARIFQYPTQKTGVAPLFIGNQGCGKGIVCNQLFSRIWQGHFLPTNDFDSVIGQFNSHLKNK